jgi:hypothetical protein
LGRGRIQFLSIFFFWLSSPLHLVYEASTSPPALALSLSPHRHPFLCIPPGSRFIRCNKQNYPSCVLFWLVCTLIFSYYLTLLESNLYDKSYVKNRDVVGVPDCKSVTYTFNDGLCSGSKMSKTVFAFC